MPRKVGADDTARQTAQGLARNPPDLARPLLKQVQARIKVDPHRTTASIAPGNLPTAVDAFRFYRDPNEKEQIMDDKRSFNRRDFLLASAGAGLMAMVPPGVPGLRAGGAWAAGSDAPEKKEVKVGFIPLTDCASIVMASVMKFDEKYGIKIVPSKEASWASVRD